MTTAKPLSMRRLEASLSNLYQPIFQQTKAHQQNSHTTSSGSYSLLEYRFWTSRIAYFIYGNTVIALATHQHWLLYGVIFSLIMQVAWVVLQWVMYVLDDPDLWKNVAFLSTWVKRFVKEGEAILSGADAKKLILAGTIVHNARTGLSYFRAILRYKISILNRSYLEDLARKTSLYNRFTKSIHKSIPPSTR
jgi:hypothetical protein